MNRSFRMVQDADAGGNLFYCDINIYKKNRCWK